MAAIKSKSNRPPCPPGFIMDASGNCVFNEKPLSSKSAKVAMSVLGSVAGAMATKVGKNTANKQAAKKTIKELDKLTAMKKGGNWIQGAIKKPGALREQLGVKKGEKIPKGKLEAAAKKGGKLGQRARLAITLGKMRKK